MAEEWLLGSLSSRDLMEIIIHFNTRIRRVSHVGGKALLDIPNILSTVDLLIRDWSLQVDCEVSFSLPWSLTDLVLVCERSGVDY